MHTHLPSIAEAADTDPIAADLYIDILAGTLTSVHDLDGVFGY
jgi:hypothetical protein